MGEASGDGKTGGIEPRCDGNSALLRIDSGQTLAREGGGVAVVLTFDPARRRRPIASCVTDADRVRVETQRALADLERERSETRQRFYVAPVGSELYNDLALRLAQMSLDIDELRRELVPDNVVRMGARHA